MIPTREQIDAYSKSDFASVKVERWLRDMYAELQFYASACSDRDGYCAQVRKLRDAIIAIGVAVGASVNDSCTTSFLCEVKGEVESVVGKLRADLDRANTEAALARDAMAKATTPAPEREAKIKAWEEWALEDAADSDLYDDCFVLERHEIENAVSMMRSAVDGKALLRELRAWMVDKARMHLREGHGWSFETGHINIASVVVRIDEMLAKPAPSPVYSRGKTIAESAEPPTAYYPPAPVEQPTAAVPDDTRELVAQLADVAAEFFVAPWCDRAKAIAKQLRGGA